MKNAKQYARAYYQLWNTSKEDERALLAKRFTELLSQKGLLPQSRTIVQEIKAMIAKDKRGERIEILSAEPLTDEVLLTEAKNISPEITEKGRSNITHVIDPHIIGGMITRSKTRERDSSYRSALYTLYQKLSK